MWPLPFAATQQLKTSPSKGSIPHRQPFLGSGAVPSTTKEPLAFRPARCRHSTSPVQLTAQPMRLLLPNDSCATLAGEERLGSLFPTWGPEGPLVLNNCCVPQPLTLFARLLISQANRLCLRRFVLQHSRAALKLRVATAALLSLQALALVESCSKRQGERTLVRKNRSLGNELLHRGSRVLPLQSCQALDAPDMKPFCTVTALRYLEVKKLSDTIQQQQRRPAGVHSAFPKQGTSKRCGVRGWEYWVST